MVHSSLRFRCRPVPGNLAAALVLAAALPGHAAVEVSVALEPTISFNEGACRAPDGSLWIVGADGQLQHGPPPVPGEDADREALGWRSVPPPPGCRIERVAVGPDGTVWATTRCRGRDTCRVVRRSADASGRDWVFEDVLFRRTEGRWESIVSPVP